MTSQSALRHVFLEGRESPGFKDTLLELVKKSMTEPQNELEAIIHGDSGENNQRIGLEQFQRIVGFLRANGKPFDKLGEQVYLNIFDEKNTKIRTTIPGDDAVSRYCMDDIIPDSATYLMKHRIKQAPPKRNTKMASETETESGVEQTGTGRPRPKKMEDEPKYYGIQDLNVGYKMNLKTESPIDSRDPIIRDMRSKWKNTRKYYRMIQRESFQMGEFFRVDCSRVRTGKGKTLEESGVLDSFTEYEVEIELITGMIPPGMSAETVLRKMMNLLLHLTRVLRGQWFIMREDEKTEILRDYATITSQDPEIISTFGSRKLRFIGPMPITLNRSAVRDVRSGSYTATLKADGERALMMIGSNGDTHLIYRTMRIESTGMIVKDKSIHRTILDGEVITKLNIAGVPTEVHPPMFLVFDAYMVGGEAVHVLPLLKSEVVTEGDAAAASSESVTEGAAAGAGSRKSDSRTRLGLASDVIDKIGGMGAYESVWGDTKYVLNRIMLKKFVFVPTTDEECKKELVALMESKIPYHTDGIIFTPNRNAVNNYTGTEIVNIKGTWNDVMKWKPPEDNTIDFLLKLLPETKDTIGGGKFREGILYVIGNDITNTDLYYLQTLPPNKISRELTSRENKVIPFRGGVSRIQLELGEGGVIRSKTDEAVQDNMIVECAWDPTLRSFMDDGTGGWVIRNIRWDKTSVYRNGVVEGTMNAERTAKSVWDTVVTDPVKLEDLWTSSAIFVDEPDGGDEETGEGYFNRKGLREASALGHMRDFHNLVVKNFLIRSGSRGNLRGAKMVDIACGKGGDIPRFQQSGASFVLGLDVVPDNILNLDDGAIRRYINIPLRNRKVDMMFALVDCGKDIFAEKSAIDDESKKIIADVFADGTKLGTRADKVTCMFAMHYFFKDLTTVDTFFHNVARILRSPSKGEVIPPCFVASYFDAGKVHRLLKDKTTSDNRTYRAMVGTDVAWSIQALYDVDAVEDAIASGSVDGPEGLGLEIKVYIRSINKWHNEYLVGRKTLKEVGLRHGLYVFEKAPKESPTDLQVAIESAGKKAGYIPGSTFDTLFKIIKASDSVGKAREMTDYEKELSFLYRWDVMLKIDKSFTG